MTYIPLAFHPDNTALSHLPTTSGFNDLKQIAVSRLMLDNIPHIKAYWVMMTPSVAQIAQRFGANDIDGTVVEEKIYHDAGATTDQHFRRQDCCALIREAGREPVERDTAYRPVTRTESAFYCSCLTIRELCPKGSISQRKPAQRFAARSWFVENPYILPAGTRHPISFILISQARPSSSRTV